MDASLPDARLVAALQGLQSSIFVDVSTYTLLIYEYLITFDDERRLIWPMSFRSPIKALYFLTRYLPFINMSILIAQHFSSGLSASECLVGVKVMGWLVCSGLMFAEVILTYRTWAVYERSRKMGIGLCIWFAIFWVPQFVIMGIFLDSLVFTTLPRHGCLGAGNPISFVNWILLMVYEAGILVLMLIKAVRVDKVYGRSPLFRTIYRDGALFYVYLFAISTLNVAVILTNPSGNSQMLNSFQHSIHSILTARLLVSIRKLAPGVDDQGDQTIGTLSTFQARSPAPA